ncbi:hypothetical protein PR048_001899 [Dryococelus australis]|uniref:DUF4371 domain-containing protein n=1 Tax=Dryococelus australis TaxID=614101 RepID=A0ABQ9IIM7_9NEOP|nr:hypothetical protein PR048_001899 [Dryococelus australis]
MYCKSQSIQAAGNREILKPIIDTVIFCGRQNIPLRCHSDYGEFHMSTQPLENEGNFRALLRERVKSGNEKLRRHFESSGRNATHINWNIQNQIVEYCNDIITNKIVGKVNSAKCLSVLADETTDIYCSEQFTLCLKYAKQDSKRGYSLQESFPQFLPLEPTDKNVAHTLIRALHEGQSYDGAASMSGKFRGTQTSLSSIRKFPMFTVPHITQKKNLKQLCPTRSVQRHEAVMVGVQLLQPVAASLEEITEWEDKDASSNAFILLNAIGQPDFIVALLSAGKLLSHALPLSKKLQAIDVDLASALSYADYNILILFRECEETARNIGSQITIPRLVKVRQVNHFDNSFFPNVHIPLKIFSSLPVSTSRPERTFLRLRRIKNYARNIT